jgi:hypothetical protein
MVLIIVAVVVIIAVVYLTTLFQYLRLHSVELIFNNTGEKSSNREASMCFSPVTSYNLSLGSIFSSEHSSQTHSVLSSTAEAKGFSTILCVQTGSGAHPDSCPMDTEGPFSGGKWWPGHDADDSRPSSTEVKTE